MFPVTVVVAPALVILSPLGWSALAGWAIGIPSAQKSAKVLSVEPIRLSTTFDESGQKAKIEIDEVRVNICTDGRVIGPAPKVGDSIAVTGRISVFGFFIEEIRVM